MSRKIIKHNFRINPCKPFYFCLSFLKSFHFAKVASDIYHFLYTFMLHGTHGRFSAFCAHCSLSNLSYIDFLLCYSVCTSAKKNWRVCVAWHKLQSLYLRLLPPPVENRSAPISIFPLFLLLAVGNYCSAHLFFVFCLHAKF